MFCFQGRKGERHSGECQERKRVWHSDLDSQMYGLQEEKMIISIYLIFLTGLRIRLKPMMVKTG